MAEDLVTVTIEGPLMTGAEGKHFPALPTNGITLAGKSLRTSPP